MAVRDELVLQRSLRSVPRNGCEGDDAPVAVAHGHRLPQHDVAPEGKLAQGALEATGVTGLTFDKVAINGQPATAPA